MKIKNLKEALSLFERYTILQHEYIMKGDSDNANNSFDKVDITEISASHK